LTDKHLISGVYQHDPHIGAIQILLNMRHFYPKTNRLS
jgi:hypothetical protein